MIAITNGSFFDGGELRSGLTVFIEDGCIAKVSADRMLDDCTVIDASGGYIHPGFVDLQIYGSGGHLFSAYPEAATLRQMDHDLIAKGTTSFLACVATNAPEVIWQAITAAKMYRKEAVGFMGLHLEGPFLNARRKGAHVEAYIEKATLKAVKELVAHADGVVKMMTIAAELQDDEVIEYLLSQDIVLSLGHSDASFEQATKAYDMGFKTTTHLFNAMPSIHHRAPNLPVAAYRHQEAMASIIADGIHVDFEVVGLSQKLMGARLFLITDAVTPCEIGPYQHTWSAGKFVTPDGTLSGSGITMLKAVQNCVQHCGIPLVDALNMASVYPLRLMNGEGSFAGICAGSKADLVLLNKDLELCRVFAGGREYGVI